VRAVKHGRANKPPRAHTPPHTLADEVSGESEPPYARTHIGGPAGPSEPTSPAPGKGESGPGEGEEEALPGESGETETDPIDSRYLTRVPFGASSFWLQPWRAYLDTWPASRLLEAVGINFNVVDPAYAEGTAQLLHESGFKLARVGIPWNAISYSNPTELRPSDEASISARLTALHKHGLRPLIILDSNSGDPAPSTAVTLDTTVEAPAGARSVTLTPTSAAAVVPGKTGFDKLTPFAGSPDILISAVGSDDVATLSRPLPQALSAGEHKGTTLAYAPFAAPTLADGEPNPAFEATLRGWLGYVAAVCREATSVVGAGGYDLEVWNELGFGSQFLNSENYYSTASEAGAGSETGAEAESSTEAEANTEAGASAEAEATNEEATSETPSKQEVTKAVIKALLDETVAYVRDPANGISPEVGITDGFASQTPFASGANAPLGLTALSKHPYTNAKTFPAAYDQPSIHPINALGRGDAGTKRDPVTPFVPTYQSDFPEYTLTATSTETVIRDLAPFTTDIYGLPHGREVSPTGGQPVQKWVTEYNLGVGHASVMGPDETTPASGPSAQLTPADRAHFQAKVALRSLVADVSTGITREYFYAAAPGALSLIGEGFWSAEKSDPSVYPGDQSGGETLSGLRNMLSQFQGPGPGPEGAKQLQLLSIAQDGNHAQFTGDGTAAHPDLYDRDVLAVFPFQTSPTRYVIPVYVMTRDMLTLYEPNQPNTDIHRFDLPNETFRITLGNLPTTTNPLVVSAYDPLRGEATPAQLVSREGDTATFEIAATDYPRLLTLEYPGS
jgi:hypothetical protein